MIKDDGSGRAGKVIKLDDYIIKTKQYFEVEEFFDSIYDIFENDINF